MPKLEFLSVSGGEGVYRVVSHLRHSANRGGKISSISWVGEGGPHGLIRARATIAQVAQTGALLEAPILCIYERPTDIRGRSLRAPPYFEAVAELRMQGPVLAQRNRLLSALAPEAISTISQKPSVDLKRGAILHERGRLIEQVFFPLGGLISLVTVLQDGRAVENAIIGNEGAVGTKTGFGRMISLTRALVQISGPAVRMETSEFQQLVRSSPALREAVSCFNEGLVAQIQQTAACYATHKLESRVCRWLLSAADRVETDSLSITQECLAATLGVHRARLNTIMGTLQARGSIRYHRRGRIELQRELLQASVCECYGVIRRREQHSTE